MEALKGLLEHQMLQEMASRGQREVEEAPKGTRTVARKSTGAGARTAPGDRLDNQTHKSSLSIILTIHCCCRYNLLSELVKKQQKNKQ